LKEFFSEMKGEEMMVVHFYRNSWPCKVMDMHLELLSKKHLAGPTLYHSSAPSLIYSSTQLNSAQLGSTQLNLSPHRCEPPVTIVLCRCVYLYHLRLLNPHPSRRRRF